MLYALCFSSLLEVILVEAGEVDLLDVSHVEDVLEEGEVAEDVLVGHLDGEGSLCSDALHCNYRIDKNHVPNANNRSRLIGQIKCG